MEIYLFEKFLVIWIKATDFRICKHQSSKPNSVPVSRVEVIPWFFWIILLQHLQKNLVMTSLSDPPLSQKGGVGGTRAIAHSIRRCRATGVAKLACYPGCCRCRRPPPSRCFLKVALKNDALACISEHFCILRISNLEKSEFSLKSFILLVFWRFLGILGGSKNRQKTREIHQKVTGRERRSSGTVFGPFLKHFFANFKAQNTVKYNVFALFVLKDNNVKMLQKHRKYRCFWRAMCRKHCKYRGFWCNVQKTSYVSRFLRLLAQKYRYLRCFFIPKCRKLRK